MSKIKSPYMVEVDIKYLEYILNLIYEQRDIINGNFKGNKGEKLFKLRIHDRAIQQLKWIIRKHKSENKI